MRLRVSFPASLFIASLLPVLSLSQGVRDSSQKATPGFLLPERSTDTTIVPAKPLPSFDVPEFVITGASAIDLPVGDKERTGRPAPLAGPLNARVTNRETPPEEDIAGQRSQSTIQPAFGGSGVATGRIGTFFSSDLSVRQSWTSPTVSFLVGGMYHRTTGWTSFSENSGGGILGSVSVPLHGAIDLLDNAAAGCNVSYGEEKYFFYGSSTPSASRDLVRVGAEFSLTNLLPEGLPYDASLRMTNLSVRDTTALVGETGARVRLRSIFDAGLAPVQATFSYETANLNGDTTAGTSAISFGAESGFPVSESGRLTVGASVGSLRGMSGQSTLRFFPSIRFEFSGLPPYHFYAGFEPKARFSDLTNALAEAPYISARSVERQSYDLLNVVAGASAEAASDIDVTAELNYSRTAEERILEEGVAPGVWRFRYGTVTKVSGRAEMVAKFSANDYFSCGLVVRSSTSDPGGARVPFVPRILANALYRRALGEFVSVTGSLKYLGQRTTGRPDGSELPAVLLMNVRIEAFLLSSTRAFLQIDNLTDRKYEFWPGYRESPAIIAVGLTTRW